MWCALSSKSTWLVLAAALGSCGGDAASSDVQDAADARVDGEVTTPQSPWTTSNVASGSVGRQLQVAISPTGVLAVAFYGDSGEVGGACGANDTSERTTWTLSYAALGDGSWRTEEAAKIVHLGPPRGFDLAFAPDGSAQIAALIGEPIPFYCGANDLGLYRRDNNGDWSGEVVVAESNEALTGEPASDFGSVVGLWPALAFGATGEPIILYKDVHGGGLQGDDFRRADLEAAYREGGGWRHVPVDWGAGAGDFNQVAVDDGGRTVVLMFHPRDELTDSKRGLWVLRSGEGGTWASSERVRVFAGGVSERPSMVVDRKGAIWVAWYDGEVGLPYVARLDEGDDFADEDAWEVRDVGDHVYDEGRQPTLAVSQDGIVALAYQRCGRASDGIGACNPTKDAIVFAWADPDDANIWEREVIADASNDDDGLCGSYIGLVFKGEAPVVFYQCQLKMGDDYDSVINSAARRPL